MKLLVADMQKEITDKRLYYFDSFIKKSKVTNTNSSPTEY